MENKGCIACRKCEQIRCGFFCGKTRLTQKQLYNKHGFCSEFEPKEQIEKPLTEQEYLQTCTTEQLAEVLYRFYRDGRNDELQRYVSINEKSFVDWLKKLHREE